MDEHSASNQLVVVANRLPVRLDEETGEWESSPGGLVSALSPVLRERQGTWVGWPGIPDRSMEPFTVDDIDQIPVMLTADEIRDYYEGFCNGTIWPLYHDAIRPVELHRHWWHPYVEVNRRFAEAVERVVRPGDMVWVQDYQLQLVPGMLREMGVENRIGYFLHIPFPPVEIFGRLPWREEVVGGLLGADVLGFQTHQSMINFGRAARSYGGASGPTEAMTVDSRVVRSETVPISIDAREFAELSASEAVAQEAESLRVNLGSPDRIILGVDRLDYTKGIDQRLKAFETLLSNRPDLRGRVVLVQIAVPSRENVGEYQLIREDIERIVGRINGAYGGDGWVPVHYYYRSLDRLELIAHYRAADVMLVTPLRDGMNLVAKEWIASRVDQSGVLILSEFAGAAEQMSAAVLVNPYDVDELASALEWAVESDLSDQQAAISILRRNVARWDVHRWASHCLESLEEVGRGAR